MIKTNQQSIVVLIFRDVYIVTWYCCCIITDLKWCPLYYLVYVSQIRARTLRTGGKRVIRKTHIVGGAVWATYSWSNIPEVSTEKVAQNKY